MTTLHHEPSRRFVVTGENIAPGAWLRIYLPTASDLAIATDTTPPTSTPTLATHPDPLEFPIFAATTSTGAIEWQTAAEIEAYALLGLMNGGLANSAVVTARDDPEWLLTSGNAPFNQDGTVGTDFFHPKKNNWFYVVVINDIANASTTTSSGSWQRITVQ
jgi:hypothetical protein